MKILFITYIPAPYRVDFFNELGKECDLTVIFEKSSSNHRDDSWGKYRFENFQGIILKRESSDYLLKIEIINYIKDKSYDEIIVHDVSTSTGMLAIQYMRFFKIDCWIESDGGFAKSGKGFKECIKKYFIKDAKGYFSTGCAGDKYLLAYGAKQNRIHRYPFTSLYPKDIISSPYSRDEKLKLRNVLSIKERFIIVSVGRFSYSNGYGKGFDVLLKLAKEIDNDFGIYIIGDDATQEFLDKKENEKLDNVHFVGFQKREELIKWYRLADIFTLMTISDVWGLVINEAMSQGLPIITTNMCGAGLELVRNNVNGYIINSGDMNKLKCYVEKLAYNVDLREKMAQKSLNIIKGYTYSNMVKRHLEILECKSS